jgi:uncharacterized protein
MSDTTPRPDETPTDPTAPPPPPPVPPVTNAADPASGAFYGQQAYAAPQPGQQPAYGQEPPPAQPASSHEYPVPYGGPPGQQMVPAPMNPSDERTWGMVSHLIPLAALVLSAGFLSFVASLVTYLVVRDRGPFVRHHAANALNVQIIAGIVMLISLPLMIILVGFVTFAAAWVFAVIVHIVGMVKANNGEWYNPPMTPQFVK